MRLGQICTALILLACVLAPHAAYAQQAAAPAFEAASIRENKSGDGGGSIRPRPGGRLVARNLPAKILIEYAYDLPAYRVAGGADWATSNKYDLDATAGREIPASELKAMLKALLTERFQLAMHTESRMLDGYVLSRVSADHLGPGIKRSTRDCRNSPDAECRENYVRFQDGVGMFKAAGVRLTDVSELVQAHLEAPVDDRTGITDSVDVDLRWLFDPLKPAAADPLPTALRDQLGLKLDRQRVRVEVYVIDHLERPTPN